MIKNLFQDRDFIISVIESSYDGIYITDKNSITLYVNKAYESLTGHDRSEYIGKSMEELMTQGLMTAHITQDVIKTKKPVTVTEQLISGKSVVVTGNPIFDENENIIACVTNIRDISEIISLEKKERLSKELISLYKNKYFDPSSLDNIVCESPITVSTFNYASKVAATDSTVLLTGETGVGKEVIAKYIHINSLRKDKNYIKINCGAIPENLLESELFGYVGGAFTGADPKGKLGLFEMADNGTLFLDEIGELPFNLQAALLRVLQDGEITRVGSTESRKVDVRIIAATNRNLWEMIENKLFREDLFYRLNVISVEIPPLRERKEDIPALVEMFIKNLNKKYNCNKTASYDFLYELSQKDWPGNIRELSNYVERQFILSDSDTISSSNTKSSNISTNNSQSNDTPLKSIDAKLLNSDDYNMDKIVSIVEAELIKSALEKSDTMNDAAKLLKISQPTFSRKYNKYKQNGLL